VEGELAAYRVKVAARAALPYGSGAPFLPPPPLEVKTFEQRAFDRKRALEEERQRQEQVAREAVERELAAAAQQRKEAREADRRPFPGNVLVALIYPDKATLRRAEWHEEDCEGKYNCTCGRALKCPSSFFEAIGCRVVYGDRNAILVFGTFADQL